MNEPVTRAVEEALPFEGIYRRYAQRGIRFAFSMLRNRADAEEVTQEAFCKLIAAHPEWQSTSSSDWEDGFAGVFFTTIRNQCIDIGRKRGRRKQVALDQTAEPASKSESNVTTLESTVTQLLEELPSQWADALKLKINGQLSYAEIADVLDASRAQVRTWIYRARRKLETELKKSEINA